MVALTRSRSGAVVRAPQRYEPDPDTVFEDDDSCDGDYSSDDVETMSSDGDDTLSDDFVIDDDDDDGTQDVALRDDVVIDDDELAQDVALRDVVDSCLVYWTHGSNITSDNVDSWMGVAAQRMVTPLPDREVLLDALKTHVASSLS
jgi:hypothetical protein